MHHFAYRAGDLHAEDVPLSELAARFGTPLFVYSHATLTRHLRVVREAFGRADPLVSYSVKANPNLAVVRTLARGGAGADVVSGGELTRALRAGVPPERIVFSGVGKRPDELAQAVDAGILCVNVEVEGELAALEALARERGREVGFALRVNPDVDARSHEYISVGARVNKFGIPLDEARALYARGARGRWLRGLGLSCHIGSQLQSMEPLVAALERVAALVRELAAEGLPARLLDVGGGLGVRYTTETPPTLEAYAAGVTGALGDLLGPEAARLVLEPGRVIVANAGVFVTRVLYRKDVAGKRFVIVDGAMNDVPRPALYGATHDVWSAREGAEAVDADVVGPVCESGDFLVRDARVPDAAPGELLAVMGAGAYCRSMSSNYNTRPRAAEVLVRGADAHLVGERETVDELMARERIPDFLR